MDQHDTLRGMIALGVTPQNLDDLRYIGSFEQAEAQLEKIKTTSKKTYKRLVLELHPDRTGGDVEKARLFDIITQVHKQIQEIRLSRQVRRQYVMVQTTTVTNGTVTYRATRTTPFRGPNTTSATTTRHGRAYNAARVAFVRPF